MDDLRFDGPVVIVTGAGRGFGRHHALGLAARGAQVVVADFGGATDGAGSSSAPADAVVGEIAATGGQAVACYASVADPDGATSIVATALDSFGRLDVVVNNARISDPGSFGDLSLDQFHRMVQVHYLGTVYVTKAAWPHVRARGYGRIVNTTSEAMFGILPRAPNQLRRSQGRHLRVDPRSRRRECSARHPGQCCRAARRDPDVRSRGDVDHPRHPGRGGRGVMPDLPPRAVSPAAVYLAHESCRLNGETLAAGGGQVQRIAVVAAKRITKTDMTPEDVAANIDAVMEVDNFDLVDVGAGM